MHKLTFAVGAVLLAGAALADGPKAHQHGVADLEVVVEGRSLSLELEGPLNNFVGFEHGPRTKAERTALDRALELLRKPETVVALPEAAGCVLTASELLNPFAVTKGGKGPDGHADLTAGYQFDCTSPAALERLDVRLFQSFPRLRKLRAAVVAPGRQSGAELSKGRTSLRLAP